MGLLQVLTITNNAAVTIHIQLTSYPDTFISFSKIFTSEMMDGHVFNLV
jgi:hypothetical protein